ncbi:MAG: hypothetical protein QNJ34_10595 [Xenococcaceae cyanobacterium MO_188.B29]|nr:hypothetical protein [Xenococcaceae cyanobacterium MO_188.B29]
MENNFNKDDDNRKILSILSHGSILLGSTVMSKCMRISKSMEKKGENEII